MYLTCIYEAHHVLKKKIKTSLMYERYDVLPVCECIMEVKKVCL